MCLLQFYVCMCLLQLYVCIFLLQFYVCICLLQLYVCIYVYCSSMCVYVYCNRVLTFPSFTIYKHLEITVVTLCLQFVRLIHQVWMAVRHILRVLNNLKYGLIGLYTIGLEYITARCICTISESTSSCIILFMLFHIMLDLVIVYNDSEFKIYGTPTVLYDINIIVCTFLFK